MTFGLVTRYIELDFAGAHLLTGRSLIVSDQEMFEFAKEHNLSSSTKNEVLDKICKSRTLSVCL